MNSSSEIRQTFLDYFKNNGHKVVASSPLVPVNDPTLLFTNAGMVQFKDVFLGNDKRSYKRAVTSQCCVRAGGKHNDLENVGYTARHHTFFEMLGNFSFGDYFKKEAIEYSWELLTRIYKVPEDKLWITVYKDDEEAANIWLKDIGVDPARFSRCGEKDNFWSMGDTGPCGPCSEIFYDHGTDIPGGPPGSPEAEGDRFVEIWNLVFTQFDRNTDGELIPIPHPSVDTGMGLERITAVLQGVHNNYEIDIFINLINAIRKLSGSKDLDLISSRVVADHIRSCAFLVADGVLPSNEGRGYVLRRIIRRAVRHGNKLGFKQPFFYKLVKALEVDMGDTYPELKNNRAHIEKVLLNEEQRFAETLEQGLKVLDEVIAKLESGTIAGKDVFRLYDTYGFPVDLTADIARERDLEVDMQGFHQAMAEQRQRARAASKFDMGMTVNTDDNLVSEFSGYERLQQKSTIIALYQDGRKVQSLNQGDVGGIIMLETPFYAQSGGQVGDKGDLTASGIFFEVEDTKKQGQSHIHLGVLRTGSIKVGDALIASVDQARRMHIMRNHSATHLLHAALRAVLGDHVVQKGSLVAPDRLRFDFSHPDPLTEEELQTIERLINLKVLENIATEIEVMSLDDAMKSGAMSLFGEKYEESVRVLKIGGEFSIELCGGTHVRYAGDIGLLKIISETGTAAGIRRIEAVTGEGALQWVDENQNILNRVAQLIKADRDNVEQKLSQYIERTRKLEKEIEQLKGQVASSAGEDMLSSALDIDGIKVIAKVLDGADQKTLRDTVDQLKNKLGSAALVLASVEDDKISLIAGVTKDKTGIIKAGELVNFVAQKVGGKGGGRPDMAQAGGNDPSALPEALASVPDWIRQQLNH